jgi:hypothetical protein
MNSDWYMLGSHMRRMPRFCGCCRACCCSAGPWALEEAPGGSATSGTRQIGQELFLSSHLHTKHFRHGPPSVSHCMCVCARARARLCVYVCGTASARRHLENKSFGEVCISRDMYRSNVDKVNQDHQRGSDCLTLVRVEHWAMPHQGLLRPISPLSDMMNRRHLQY